MPVIVHCDFCGDSIKKNPSHVKPRNYCDRTCYHTGRIKSVEERLSSKVCRVPTEEGCLLWTGAKNSEGYGHMMDTDGRIRAAHILVWELHHSRGAPKGMYICHSCDVPSCVNPKHLFLGTSSDNARDRERKNRRRPPAGILNGNAKLTNTKVRHMRRLRENNPSRWSYAALASKFCSSKTNVARVVKGTRWTHVD